MTVALGRLHAIDSALESSHRYPHLEDDALLHAAQLGAGLSQLDPPLHDKRARRGVGQGDRDLAPERPAAIRVPPEEILVGGRGARVHRHCGPVFPVSGQALEAPPTSLTG